MSGNIQERHVRQQSLLAEGNATAKADAMEEAGREAPAGEEKCRNNIKGHRKEMFKVEKRQQPYHPPNVPEEETVKWVPSQTAS